MPDIPVCILLNLVILKGIIRIIQAVLYSPEFLYSFREIEKPLIFQIFAKIILSLNENGKDR
jgi:hypothetical protein